MSDAFLLEGLSRLARAEVVGFCEDGNILVRRDDGTTQTCEWLRTSDPAIELRAGDRVLCWFAESALGSGPGVVLGAVGPRTVSSADETPEELVLEARRGLILKCGDGSITIRADGKILIKGKDLVSHAQRVNRIKGGSVAIN